MKRSGLLLYLLVISTVFLNAQSSTSADFLNFATKQDSLFVASYKLQDVKQYNKLLSEFIKKYKKLSAADQKQYANYYINAYYNLSCLYALQNKKDNALQYLDAAIQAGYTGYAHMQVDSDLDNIRNDPKFISLVQPLRELGDYLYILKKDNRFDTAKEALPRFTYQSQSDPELMRLRKTFNLDSIAGGGNDVSKFINVLHWVHNTVPHDGQHESGITQINALEIETVSVQRKVGVSCGELATVLNECYLALGFKSRKIYCFPKDSLRTDYDSHVINVVYAPDLKKWLWMDPTNDAYVMNEQGELLGIAEVRDRLINGLPLLVNPDANWNHKASTTKEDYLYRYMAKNLYRFYCTTDNRYDLETRGKEKTVTYLNLVPDGYGRFSEVPHRMENYNTSLKTTFINYTTHNPEAFWKTPD